MDIEKRILKQVRILQEVADALTGVAMDLEDEISSSYTLSIPTTEDAITEELLSARQVQELIGIGESTFYTWIREKRLPRGELFGKRMRRWRRSEILSGPPSVGA